MLTNKQVFKIQSEWYEGGELEQLVRKSLIPERPHRPSGLHLKFPYDLREGMKEKENSCHPECRWTAFLNNSGNLCHVVCPEAGLMVRITFVYPINHLPHEKQLSIVKMILEPVISL